MDTDIVVSKRKRGRPRKVQSPPPVITENEVEEIIEIPAPPAKEPEKETIVEDKVEEEEEPKKVKVKRVEIDGKKYLKTHDNILYDEATSEVVGTFDEESNTIKPYEEEDEIEEEDYEEDEKMKMA